MHKRQKWEEGMHVLGSVQTTVILLAPAETPVSAIPILNQFLMSQNPIANVFGFLRCNPPTPHLSLLHPLRPCGSNLSGGKQWGTQKRERDGRHSFGDYGIHVRVWSGEGWCRPKSSLAWITVLYCVNISGLNKLWHPERRRPAFCTH